MTPRTSELIDNTQVASGDDSEPPGAGSASGVDSVEIAISNEQALLTIDEEAVRRAVRQVLSAGNEPSATISVAIVDDATMRPLNKQFLEHDYTTDVLSFALNEAEEPLSGELIVNAEYAAREAVEIGWSAEEEFLLYVIHGMLHLIGYCDKSDESAIKMRAAEKQILIKLGIQTSTSDSRWADGGQAKLSGRKGTTHS
ncbi:MAG: rRNA maturation RNase YbeY [Lacipirellulaceae bacterium]